MSDVSHAPIDTPPLITFLPYQRAWLEDAARFKIGKFARQTGKTFTTCAEIVADCIAAEIEGRRTRWVILSRGERQAKEAMNENIKPFVKAHYELYKSLRGEPRYEEGATKSEGGAQYNSLEVIFPGGSRITALPANPDTARGFSANVFLDEFALHQNSREIWKALFPVISKPGLKLRVVSTPNGRSNKFFELMTSDDPVWSRHRIDIHQAVEAGLDRNVEELRAAAGDEDMWRQEFLLEWLDEASAWLDYDLISNAEDPKAGDPGAYTGGPCWIGNDIARRRDFWVAWVWEQVGDVFWAREIQAHRRISFAEQDAILDGLVARYNPVRIAMDQTNMGEKPVEDAQRRYGASRVEGVYFTQARKLDVATAAKQIFEDRRARIPEGDPILRADLHGIKKLVGPTGHPRLIAERDGNGHSDRAWAAMLGLAAAVSAPPVPLEFRSTGIRRVGMQDAEIGFTDRGFGTISGSMDRSFF